MGASEKFFNALADIIEAMLFAISASILYPLRVFGEIFSRKHIGLVRILLPHGQLSSFLRGLCEMRFARLDAAIMEFECIVGVLEGVFTSEKAMKKDCRRLIAVLEQLYSLLARSYLDAGHLEDAILLVLRSKTTIGLDALKGLPELNTKSAQLFRAAMRAGKLLDDGAFATLFVQTAQARELERSKKQYRKLQKPLGSKPIAEPEQNINSTSTAKIIPFPLN